MAKSADDAAVPPICAAIADALAKSSDSLRVVAQRAGLPYQSLQKYAANQEPKLDKIRLLEQALRPDAPRGWLLVAAGAVEISLTPEDAIRSDIRLNEQAVVTVLNVLESQVGLSSSVRTRRS